MKISKDIVVFDGVCALCNGVFKWLIENDKQEQFMYTNFQSNYSKENNLYSLESKQTNEYRL